MRQIAMKNYSTPLTLLAGVFFLLINPFGATAQIDQDNMNVATTDPSIFLQCNNFDQNQFEDDVRDIIENLAYSDTNSGQCNGDGPTYDDHTIVSSFPYDCDNGSGSNIEVEVEVDLVCDGGIETITVTITVEDNAIPYDLASGPDNTLVDPSVMEPCDFNTTDADIQAWIADIENNDFGGSQVFGDNCTDNTALSITVLNDPTPLDFTTMDGCMSFAIDFEVIDDCGNPETFTFTYEVEDDTNPQFLAIPDVMEECGLGSGDPQQDFDDWYDDIINNPNTYAEDDCDTDIVISDDGGPYTVDLTSCSGQEVWSQNITFVVTDECGNTNDITVNYTIADTADPFLAGGPLPDELVECDQGVNSTDFDLWLNNIINNPATFFDDDCADAADLTVTADITSINPDYEQCNGGFILEEEVTFTVEDPCGNSEDFTAFFRIQDTTAPSFNITPSGNTFGCTDEAGIIGELENLLITGLVEDCAGTAGLTIDDFDIVEDLTDINTWNINLTGCTGTADFTVTYTDPCGTVSNTEIVTVDLADTSPPVIIDVAGDPVPPGTDPNGQVFMLNCNAAPFTPPAVVSEDDCNGIQIHDNPIETLPLDCSQNLIWEYDDIEDPCGNQVTLILEGNIEPGDPLTNLMPEIGSGDCNVEFALTIPQCQAQSPFCFPDPLLWVNDPIAPTPDCVWPFFPAEGVVFEGGCPPYFYVFNPGNPTPGPSNTTVTGINGGDDAVFECIDIPYQGTVEWTVIDACGDIIEWSFDINVLCINCPPMVSCGTTQITLPPCGTCEEADVIADPTTPCHACDAEVLSGFCSCTPPAPVPGGTDPDQFNQNALCDDGFVANNISWFSFTAGGPNIDIDVTNVDCIAAGAIGIQVGVFAECALGTCLGQDNTCGGLEDKFVSLTGLTVGEVYYIYVDGCAGAGCTFEITVSGQAPFILPEPVEVLVTNECDGTELNDSCGSDDSVTICPGQEITILVTHDGDTPTEFTPPFANECETYDPEMDAEYIWTISPAITDATMGEIGGAGDLISFFTPDDEFQFPPLVPTSLGTFEICLEQVVTPCDFTDERACVTVIVNPLPPEEADFRVCLRDLTAPGGWDPNVENDWINFGMPGTSGQLEWQGGNITLDGTTGIMTAENAGPGEIFDADGCFTYIAMDPCGCLVDQTICITQAGTACRDAEIVDMYMFECQFIEFDDDELDGAEYMQYCWLWDMANNPDIENPKLDSFLIGNTCITIEMNSQEFGDWGDQDFCDTIVKPNIMIASIDGEIMPGDCTASGTPWTFELCTEQGDCYDRDWPEIMTDAIVWVDCDNGDPVFTGATFVANSDQTLCVKATYSFNDGAWGGDDPFSNFGTVPTACDWIFGPFELTSSTATEPVVEGGLSFCETDLTGHSYTIPNAVAGDVYNWSGPAGTVITPSTGPSVTVDFPAGMSSVTLTVDAVTSCGPASGDLTINFTESPTVTIPAVPAACLEDNVTLTANTSGGTGPYTYLWNPAAPDGPTATYPATDLGTTNVTVVVTDANGCESLQAAGGFETLEPLDATVIDCEDISDSTIGFSWEAVPGATGYNVTWTGAATDSMSAGVNELSIPTISGLSINQSVTITVIPTGDAPCGDGPAAMFTCTTDNCPDPDFVFAPDVLTYCEESPVAAFTYQDQVTANDGGNLEFMDPSGAVSTNGDFDPSVLTPGTYTITTVYFYNNNQCNRPGPTVTIVVEPTPAADFTLDPFVCIDEVANLDASNITGSASYDFDDPTGTVSLANLSWESAGPKTVVVTVTSAAGCMNSSQQMITVLDTLQPISFNACDTDVNFVHFDWDDVDGATGYNLSWTTSEGDFDSVVNWPDSEYRELNNLDQNETVTMTVTAIAGPDFCRDVTATFDCTAGACDFLAAPQPMCADEGVDFVTFDWAPVTDANGTVVTDYIVVLGGQQFPVTETSYTVPDLCPGEDVRIRVISVNPDPNCPDSFESDLSDPCSTFPCPDLDVACDLSAVPDGSTTVVGFMWNDIPGVTEYQLAYSVDGGPLVDLPSQSPGDKNWSDDIFGPGQNVQLFVSAIIGTCPACVDDEGCPVGDCPDPVYGDPMQTVCWNGVDAILLEEPVITDENGNVLTGDFSWDDPDVLSTGDFTPPDSEQSMTYTINYDFIDAVSLCSYSNAVTVTVNILPTVIINPIPDLCEGSTASISAMDFVDAAAVGNWTFEDGDISTAMGEGPIDVTYNNNGIYDVTLTVESAPGCDMTASTTVQVDEVGEPIVFTDCGFTNTSASWSWNNVGSTYLITVVNTATGQIVLPFDQSPSFLSSVTVDDLDSDVEYEITVTVESTNTCPDVVNSATCTPSSCPQAGFDTGATYSFGGFCPGDGGTIALTPGTLQGAPADNVASETWTAQNPDFQGALDANGNFNTDAISALPATILVDYDVVYAGEGCSYDTTFTIELFDEPFISNLVPEPVDCILDEVPQFEILADGGIEPYIYEIARDDPPGEVQNGSIYIVTSPGNYNVTITDANGCTDTSVITVEAAETPTVEIDGPSVIFNEETGTFDAILTGTTAPITEVQWFINDSLLITGADQDALEVLASIEDLGTQFEIRVVVFFGPDCFVESEVRVVDIVDTERIYIPNVISPGATTQGDDRWRMFTKGSVVVQRYSIYDRWGELIFVKELDPMIDATPLPRPQTATEWDLGWTGEWGRPDSFEGEAIQGVYVYVINLTIDGREEIEAGDLTIFR